MNLTKSFHGNDSVFVFAFKLPWLIHFGLKKSIQLCMRCRLSQSCKWNERSLNRGLNRGRGLGSDATFFWASCSNLEIDENFRISHKLGLGLAAKISQAFAIQLGRYQGQNTHPAHLPTPQRILIWCVGALLAAHVLTIWWGDEVTPPPIPSPPSSPPEYIVIHINSHLGLVLGVGGSRKTKSRARPRRDFFSWQR